MSSVSKRAVNGAVTGLLQNGLAMLSQLVMTPVILATAGQETMGGYAILMQIVGYTLLLDLGFSVALQRFLAQATDPEVSGDRFAVLFKIGSFFLFIINTTMCLVLMATSFYLDRLLQADQTVLWQAQLALFIQAIWMVLRTPIYLFNPALLAVQEMATLNLIAIPVNVFRIIFSLGSVYGGLGLVGLILANVTAEAVGYFGQRAIFMRRYRDMLVVVPRAMDWIQFKEVFRFGLSYWGVNLSVVLLLGSDNLVVGTLFGAATASVFYTTKMIGSLSVSVLSRIIDNVFPGAAFISGRNDWFALKAAYLRLVRYLMATLLPVVLAITLFTEWLVTAWVGVTQYAGDLMSAFVACFVLLQVFAHLHGILTVATGRIQYWNYISIACGVVAVFMSFFLGFQFGIEYVIAGICVSLLPLVLFLFLRIKSTLQFSMYEFFQAAKISLFFLPIFLVFYAIKNQLVYSLLNLVICLISYCLVWLVFVWLMVITHEERDSIKKFLRLRVLLIS